MKKETVVLSMALDSDSYKLSHWKLYPPNTTAMYSYFESRGGHGDYTVFFGLQYYLKRYLATPITVEDVEEAKEFAIIHGVPFNYDGWMYIAKDLKGKLPVRIKAVPEGSVLPKHNILFSVESTDPKVFWITSWLETLLVRIWYSISVATNSYAIKQTIKDYLDKTSDDPEGEIGFKLHDFGSRGSTSQESAMVGGASHLVNFMGSDTIAGIWMANKYYDCKMSAYSIPASEHSTITMWKKENEVEAYRNMIKQFGDTGIFACVSDSYDIYNATEKLWGEVLKSEVENMKAVLVVRPDSGDPIKVIRDLLVILDKKFGHTLNSKGYKVLNKVRLIQGDGIDGQDVGMILGNAMIDGYSATNIAFGMGAGLLQKGLDRDTHKFAFKCSWAMVDGKEVEVFKQPITDPGKRSKSGILDLQVTEYNGQKFVKTVKGKAITEEVVDGPMTIRQYSLLRPIYENGEILIEDNLSDIRKRSEETYSVDNGWEDKKI